MVDRENREMRGAGVLPWRSGESGDEGEMGLAVESCRIVERGGCG